MIGGGDWAQDRLVPDIIRAFQMGKLVDIRNPHAIRPWQHVLEPLRGYLVLAERLYLYGADFAEAWNFGPYDRDVKPVKFIVKLMASLWGEGAQWVIDDASHPHEATYLKLDISKAGTRLDWCPVLSLEKAIELTVQWARAWKAGNDMQQFTFEQIERYQQLVAI